MPYNELFFKRAFDLAEKGRGKTSPNPFVGAVIIKDNKIVGEGYTQPCGLDHAEIQALKQAKHLAKNAEMYVTLEPCSHFGKTPPCVDAIIKAGIKTVYAGIKDPNLLVNGKGFKKLREAGIKVVDGIWERKITKQLEYFIKYIRKKIPFVIMKNAVTLDGKIATESNDSKWITGEKSREEVHKLRNEVDAIITGIGTIKADNPFFNVRLENVKKNNPVRIILDSELEISLESNIVQTASEIKTIIFKSSQNINYEKMNLLKSKGLQIETLPAVNGFLDLHELLVFLYKMNFYVVMVEAGPKISSSFLKENLVDKIHYYLAPKICGGTKSVFNNINIDKMSDSIELDIVSLDKLENDYRLIAYIKK